MGGMRKGDGARQQRHLIAQETLDIMRAGGYVAPDGEWQDLHECLAACAEGTVEYLHPTPWPRCAENNRYNTSVDLSDTDTIVSALRLSQAGLSVVALNFASAKHPGGGWLGGAQAQEESITRKSGLYASLTSLAGQKHFKAQAVAIKEGGSGLYGHSVVYTPSTCPVFRDELDALLPRPFHCAFISAPAPNRGVCSSRGISDEELLEVLRERAGKVMRIAAAHGHDGVVLGAWGCGVFRNDPRAVAGVFRDLLQGDFRGVFRHVAFPLRHDANREAFEQVLAPLVEVQAAAPLITAAARARQTTSRKTRGLQDNRKPVTDRGRQPR
mmetsp:Transcript_5508/g.19158  ORF Transcript_5508/g.19158 Transcript_5508/m.19158 type:complete len:327 (+) Transcript_5508:1592-2572(+)